MRLRVEQARRDGTRDGWDGYRADAFLAAIAAGGSGATTTRPAAKHPPAATATATAHTEAPTADTEADNEGRLFVPGDDIGSADGLDPKVNWNLVVLVDGIALKRGYAAPGETCEIPGIGPIPVAWIDTLLPHVHTEMLIHDSVDIRAYATNTRHRTRPVELAVRVRDRDCTVPRCHRDPTEFDHRVPFADTHDTSVANGNRVCTSDHRDKTHHGSTLDRDDTHWRYWPPGTDPTTTPPMTPRSANTSPPGTSTTSRVTSPSLATALPMTRHRSTSTDQAAQRRGRSRTWAEASPPSHRSTTSAGGSTVRCTKARAIGPSSGERTELVTAPTTLA